MALFPVEYAHNYKIVATASANKTYANQLLQLYSAFQNLSEDEKLRSILFTESTAGGSNNVYHISSTVGIFTRIGYNESTNIVYLFYCDIDTQKYMYMTISASASSPNDASDFNHTQPLYLAVLQE